MMIFGIDESILNLIFNGVLVLAILGLWGMWFYQAGQRKKVEGLLRQAASDLQQATTLLDQVMLQMPQQKQADAQHTNLASSQVDKPLAQNKSKIVHQMAQKNPSIQPKHITKEPQQEVNMSAKIMRLKREGLDMQGIAKTLSLPIAQVRLMLLLQTAKA